MIVVLVVILAVIGFLLINDSGDDDTPTTTTPTSQPDTPTTKAPPTTAAPTTAPPTTAPPTTAATTPETTTPGSQLTGGQPYFDLLEDAEAWKADSDRQFKEHGTTLDPVAWQAARSVAGLSVVVPGTAIRRSTLREFLPKAIEHLGSRQTDPRKFGTNGGILQRFFEEQNALDLFVDTISGGIAQDLPRWVHDENYCHDSQKAVVQTAKDVWERAIACDHTLKNPFAGERALNLELPLYDRRGRLRTEGKADPWTPAELVSMARLLAPVYRDPFWIMLTSGERRSEGAGTQLGEWGSATQDLQVHEQRTGSPRQGRRRPKSPASRRPIPVGQNVAGLIDDYIARVHHLRPTGGPELEAWEQTYMFKGVQGGAMDQASLCKAVKTACTQLGLVPEKIGAFQPLHHLRYTIAYILERSGWQLSPKAISAYLGHSVPDAAIGDSSARVTRKHYTAKVAGDLERIAEYIDHWIETEIYPLTGGDLIDLTSIDDGVDLDTAAYLLSVGPGEVTSADVLDFVNAGELRCDLSPRSRIAQIPLVSAQEVTALAARLIRDTADTYCGAEAAAILATDHKGLYRLVKDGSIIEHVSDPRRRVGARGSGTGSVPGGGRRFDRASVDLLAATDADGIRKRREWLTPKQVADNLKISTSVVRRAADSGELECWRDPRTPQRRRLISPESVRVWQSAREVISLKAAAEMLDATESEIRGLVKLDRLKRGEAPGQVRKASVEAELQRRKAA